MEYRKGKRDKADSSTSKRMVEKGKFSQLMRRDASSDVNLVRRWKSGEVEAFGELVGKYQDSLYNLIFRLVGRREEARDLTQETFLRAYENMDSFKAGRPFKPWLLRIGANAAIDYLRLQEKGAVSLDACYKEGEIPDHLSLDVYSGGEKSDNPEDLSISTRMVELVDEALANLDPRYRAVLILRYTEGMTYREVGKVLGVPVSTAKTWERRGKAILFEVLKGEM